LRLGGMDVIHAGEAGLATADDSDILVWSRQAERVVITLDADFHRLLALSGATAPSVIRIRIEGLRDQALADLIRHVVNSKAIDLTHGCAITVTPASLRVHRLPFAPESLK
jgi:predicted nuclease of predicted toxin-antitoxin system